MIRSFLVKFHIIIVAMRYWPNCCSKTMFKATVGILYAFYVLYML